ncbi:4-hydroxy-tetrahydrodipicolinate synthase [Curtobacterium sp. SGAir0471]|uniref:4-hydroxy-tetrahydrodipicolinate synthase n=1 Tax=Curtobacterium sp. SGAir0471 TaxID=2070337 RepID=UPI0010CCF716|nr:4-hydroxy-tetrahydrodipicolinate synthase [Curtobacterium sp. SGAir0471]QCR42681.1 4-hydroxy-tetrahydrodipicolinate synthase [Curtobacterium sp. SGAir0471]
MTTTIRGSIHALVTPFHDDESLNLDQMRVHTDRAVRAGADGVFCLGTNGEFFQQTEDERLAVLEAVVDATAGRVPVYGGAGAVGTKETVRIAQRMQAAGADVLSVITPYFAAASQDELYRHFATVAEAVDIPVLIYNIPARTGNTIAPATVARLAELDTIAGVKDSSGNFDAILQVIELTDPEHFAVLAGTDSLVLPTLQAGGAGGITAVANVYPRTMVEIFRRWAAGDLEGARAAQASIRSLRNLFTLGNPNTIVKAATNAAGEAVGPCRAPFNLLGDAALAKIAETVRADQAAGLG